MLVATARQASRDRWAPPPRPPQHARRQPRPARPRRGRAAARRRSLGGERRRPTLRDDAARPQRRQPVLPRGAGRPRSTDDGGRPRRRPARRCPTRCGASSRPASTPSTPDERAVLEDAAVVGPAGPGRRRCARWRASMHRERRRRRRARRARRQGAARGRRRRLGVPLRPRPRGRLRHAHQGRAGQAPRGIAGWIADATSRTSASTVDAARRRAGGRRPDVDDATSTARLPLARRPSSWPSWAPDRGAGRPRRAGRLRGSTGAARRASGATPARGRAAVRPGPRAGRRPSRAAAASACCSAGPGCAGRAGTSTGPATDAEAALAAAGGDRRPQRRGAAVLRLGEIERAPATSTPPLAGLDQAVDAFAARRRRAGPGRGAAPARAWPQLFARRHRRRPRRRSTRRSSAFRAVGDRRGQAWALQNLAWIAYVAGRIDEAEVAAEAHRRCSPRSATRVGLGLGAGLLAFVRFHQGRFAEAEALAEQILARGRASAATAGPGMMLACSASLRLWSGTGRRARWPDRRRPRVVPRPRRPVGLSAQAWRTYGRAPGHDRAHRRGLRRCSTPSRRRASTASDAAPVGRRRRAPRWRWPCRSASPAGRLRSLDAECRATTTATALGGAGRVARPLAAVATRSSDGRSAAGCPTDRRRGLRLRRCAPRSRRWPARDRRRDLAAAAAVPPSRTRRPTSTAPLADVAAGAGPGPRRRRVDEARAGSPPPRRRSSATDDRVGQAVVGLAGRSRPRPAAARGAWPTLGAADRAWPASASVAAGWATAFGLAPAPRRAAVLSPSAPTGPRCAAGRHSGGREVSGYLLGCGVDAEVRLHGLEALGNFSLASSSETAGTMMTSSPCFQFAGVATLCLAVSWSESMTRRISSKLRPVRGRVGERELHLVVGADDEHRAHGDACRSALRVDHVVEVGDLAVGVGDQREVRARCPVSP